MPLIILYEPMKDVIKITKMSWKMKEHMPDAMPKTNAKLINEAKPPACWSNRSINVPSNAPHIVDIVTSPTRSYFAKKYAGINAKIIKAGLAKKLKFDETPPIKYLKNGIIIAKSPRL